MIVFPAIDIKNQKCVRLKQGLLSETTIYNEDPIHQAAIFADKGFPWLHVVDLDGAFYGKDSPNKPLIVQLLHQTDAKIQFGGGIRDFDSIAYWIDEGVDRIVLGTIAITNETLVKEAAAAFPGQIALALDAKNGFVSVEGWTKTTSTTIFDLIYKFEDYGVAALIYTDINKDGMLSGPNLETAIEIAQKASLPIIISGGIHNMEDLEQIAALNHPGIIGAISGKAIYDGMITLDEALQFMKQHA